MWNLPIPSQVEAIALSNAMIDRSSNEHVSTHGLNELYNEYTRLGGRPNQILLGAQIPTDLQAVCKQAYKLTYKNKPFSGFRDQLLLSTEKCPYCGIDAPTELDHHLPQSIYHALAIYHRNLVPVCHPCNKAKDNLNGANDNEHFVHPYLEELPQVRFFTAKTRIVNEALVATFEVRSSALNPEIRKRLEFQITRLKLHGRYQREINDFLVSIQTTILSFADVPRSKWFIEDFLERSAKDYKESFGDNDWRTALLYGLKENEDFCAGGFKNVYERLKVRRRLLAR